MMAEVISYIGHESTALIGAAIGGAVMHFARLGYDTYKDYKKRRNLEIIPKMLDADLNVYQDLTTLLIETNADRAYVMQFHNGVYYLNQANHMKVSCTHEIVKEGISRIQDTMQEVLLSKFADPMSQVLGNGVSIFDVEDQPESYYKNLIKSHGTSRSVAAIMMEGNVVEGAVVINYIEDNEMIKVMNFDQVRQQVLNAADAIGFKLRKK